MSKKTYFYIFCAIFAQEIVGTFLKGDLGNSRNFLVRQKRVINRLPGQDVPVQSGLDKHLINIKKNNRLYCVGAILSFRTAITAARCVTLDVTNYAIFSGSTYTSLGSFHNITNKKIQRIQEAAGHRFLPGIALIYVHPPFQYNQNTHSIDLYVGPILTGMKATVSGWGNYHYGGQCQTNHPRRLRSIIVPIISHQDCVASYRNQFTITESHICTFDKDKQCGHTDTGAPLIIDQHLAAIYLGVIETGDDNLLKPDVYIMVQHSEHHQWILSNIVH